MGKKVAIVGSGCSGIAALWALNTSTDHEVHLFEAESRLGGHTNTVTFEAPNGATVDVDAGFIVMNLATYPNFIRFLNEVGVSTKKTEMTFGVSRDQGSFEWAGTSIGSIFAQTKNLFSPGMWRMIFDIIRFNEFAIDLLHAESESENDVADKMEAGSKNKPVAEETIGDYLDRENYSQEFRDDYLIPMTAAVWSTSPDKCSLEFPAVTLVRFMYNHHLLSTVARRPDWMTIPGGSKQYLDAVLQGFDKTRINVECKVTALETVDDKVVLTANGRDQEFDHVILATHGDQALEIVKSGATQEEVGILSGFQTSRNVAVLHSDLALMPKRRVAWSAWNYITESPFPPTNSQNISKVCLTYWMNLLQHIPDDKYGPVLVTLNPLNMPDPQLAQGIWEYSHPLYNATAIKSQKLLPRIQNIRNISYCGAWTKYGFHEDGFSSGLSVAVNHLGARLPFQFVDSTFSRGARPIMTWKNHVARSLILSVQIVMLLFGKAYTTLAAILDRRIASRRKTA